MKKTTTLLAAAFVVSLAATRAWAEDAPILMDRGGVAGVGLVLGAKLGGGFSQPFGPLKSSFVSEVEVGWLLPLPKPVHRRFELFVTTGYSGPSASGSAPADPRLPGDGVMRWDVMQRQLIVTAGLLYRQPLPGAMRPLRPYVAAGARCYMMRTEVKARVDGKPFGENRETATDWGFHGALGADWFVGPGSALLELQVGYTRISHYVLRDTNVGALNVLAGYRFYL